MEAGLRRSNQHFGERFLTGNLASARTFFEAVKDRSKLGVLPPVSLNDAKAGGRLAALKDFDVITLVELELDVVHSERVFYGRLSGGFSKYAAVHTFLEDEFGQVALCVHNVGSSMESWKKMQTDFPEGLQVAIKNPFLKSGLEGYKVVLVKNPADLVRIAHPDDPQKPDNQDARFERILNGFSRAGDDLFTDVNFLRATFNYSMFINVAAIHYGDRLGRMPSDLKKKMKRARSNRAQALMQLRTVSRDDVKTLDLQSQMEDPTTNMTLSYDMGKNDVEAKKVTKLHRLRRSGDEMLGAEDWLGAMIFYTKCINLGVVQNAEDPEVASMFAKDVIQHAHSHRAEAHFQLRKFTEALADAEKALELDPSHDWTYCRQGRAAMALGLYEKACKAYSTLLRRCPDEPSARQNLRTCTEALVRAHRAATGRGSGGGNQG